MLLSSIYPRIDHAAGKVGPAFPRRLAMPRVLRPVRRVAGVGRGAPVVIGSFYGRHRRFLSPVNHHPAPARPPPKRPTRRQRYTCPKKPAPADPSHECPIRDKTWPDILDTPHYTSLTHQRIDNAPIPSRARQPPQLVQLTWKPASTPAPPAQPPPSRPPRPSPAPSTRCSARSAFRTCSTT
ncbi:uncharacterized protein BCN122_I1230 [Burkholderia cenocepacia]|nr:uncharacterized protein BCN122_I1230 [Burkholderia cenocepacia]